MFVWGWLFTFIFKYVFHSESQNDNVTSTLVLNSAFAIAEIQKASTSSFLQHVQVSLNVRTTLQYINH